MDPAKIWAAYRLGEPRVSDSTIRYLRGFPHVLLTLCLTGTLAAQQPPMGPLTAEEGAPIHRIALVPTMEGADPVARGQVTTDLWLGLSNIFEQDSTDTHLLYMDMERLLTALTVRWGAAEGFELGARVTLETTGGGVLDGFVLWYHDALGFGQANRDRFPSDLYEERLENGQGTLVRDAGARTLGLDDVRLFAKWRALASEDGRSVLGLKAVGWLPAQSKSVGERRADAALLALARLGMGSWYLHGMLGVASARASRQLEPVLRDGVVHFSIALERSFGSSVAGVLQYQVSTPLLQGFRHRELDGVASNLVVGLAGRVGQRWRWDVGFQEDVPADTPAIDFTLGVRLSRSWK